MSKPNADPAPDAKDAIIYVPGLRLGIGGEKSKRGVAIRIAAAMDAQAHTRSAAFPITWKDGAVSDERGGSNVATISRTDEGEPVPVVDFFAYDWSIELAERWEKQNRLKRAWRLAMTLLSVPSFLRFFTTSGKKNPPDERSS